MTHTSQLENPEPSRKVPAERGATLVEAVLFTVIALGFVTGGLVLFEQASSSLRTNEIIRALASLQSQVRALFQTQSNFGTADMAPLLIASNAVPSAFQRDSNDDGKNDKMISPLGGDMTVTGATANFTVKLDDVPVDICARIAAFDSAGNGTIGNGIVSVSDGTATDKNGLTATEAATFCAANATGGKLDLTWTFGR